MNKLASHNSFTYLRPWRWWMRPFAFMARCQRADWREQWIDYDVDLFDLRVRFDKRGDPIICHGLMEYKGNVYALLCDMEKHAEKAGTEIYIRIVSETKRPTEIDTELYINFCLKIEWRYPQLRFFGGNDRSDWDCRHPYYKFRTPAQDLDDKYSSTTTLFPRGFKWLRFLDDLCPILYARLHNRRNIERGTSHEWLFIDFVDIR